MKENVAILIPSMRQFYSHGEPTCAITTLDTVLPNHDVEDHIILDYSFIDYLIPGEIWQLDDMIKYISIYWKRLRTISIEGQKFTTRNAHFIDDLYPVNGVTITKRLKTIPTRTYYPHTDNTYYEIDVHACVVAMLNYTYYLSKNSSYHDDDELIENPLKHVSKVKWSEDFSGNRFITPVRDSYRGDDVYYLCSRTNKNSNNLHRIVKGCKAIIKDCWIKYNYDISRVVYGIFLGSMYSVLPAKDKSKLLNDSRSLMQVSSLGFILQTNRYGKVLMDAVHVKKYIESDETTDKFLRCKHIDPIHKVVGHRYLRRRNRSTIPLMFDDSRMTDSQSVSLNLLSKYSAHLGWYTYSPKSVQEGRLFHIDIHDAYPRLYYQYTGKTVSKREFGKVKFTDIELYQKIRISVTERSKEILNSFDNELIYWRTDGGIVMCKDDSFIEKLVMDNPDLLVEEIIETEPLYLHPSLELTDDISMTLREERIFAYKVTTADCVKIIYANQFETYKDRILDVNDMIGLRNYNSNLLSKVLTSRKP